MELLNADSILSINPELPSHRSIQLLTTSGAATKIVVSTEVSHHLGVSHRQSISNAEFRALLFENNILFQEPDLLFYFDEGGIPSPECPFQVRPLDSADQEIFEQFLAANTQEDLDVAYIELNHWLVFGLLEQNKMVCAASAYPWGKNSQIADIGVLCDPRHRGKGYASKLIREISARSRTLDFEPQYRCQEANLPSRRLAKKAGLSFFGKWEVASPNTIAKSR